MIRGESDALRRERGLRKPKVVPSDTDTLSHTETANFKIDKWGETWGNLRAPVQTKQKVQLQESAFMFLKQPASGSKGRSRLPCRKLTSDCCAWPTKLILCCSKEKKRMDYLKLKCILTPVITSHCDQINQDPCLR